MKKTMDLIHALACRYCNGNESSYISGSEMKHLERIATIFVDGQNKQLESLCLAYSNAKNDGDSTYFLCEIQKIRCEQE